MIQLDNDYATTEAAEGGQYNPPPPGGYVFQVLEVSEKPSSTGKDMITLTMDIAEGEFEGVFTKFPKKYCQLVNGDNLAYFKAMVKAFQESNSEHKMSGFIRNNQVDPQQLKGCIVGGCLREEEYRNKEGQIAMGLKIAWLCPISQVNEIKPPKPKKLQGQAQAPGRTFSRPASLPPQAEDDLPF